tara:strand:- start:284 stop:385 length:102 start_codon:yes stop_codon:yes gene_type:complete
MKKLATALAYKHFSPRWMEIIDELEDAATKLPR